MKHNHLIVEQPCPAHRHDTSIASSFAMKRDARGLPSVTLSPDLWLALSALADHEGRDVNDLVVTLIGRGAR